MDNKFTTDWVLIIIDYNRLDTNNMCDGHVNWLSVNYWKTSWSMNVKKVSSDFSWVNFGWTLASEVYSWEGEKEDGNKKWRRRRIRSREGKKGLCFM